MKKKNNNLIIFMKIQYKEGKKEYAIINESILNKGRKRKNYNSFFNIKIFILILIILELFFIIYFYSRIKTFKCTNNNIIINTNENGNENVVMDKENSLNISHVSREEALKIGKEYLDICQKGILINNITIKEYKNPIISAIIPVYNSQNTIKRTIRSIQNQKMLNIEIILVNDLPSDNTTKIIEEMQKEDSRIKIIYNQKNMGTLYSRCIGALEARGKYLTTIDNDDLFSNRDIFNIIYYETENEYFDIISFRAFVQYGSRYENDFLTIKNDKKPYKYFQPELGIYPVANNESISPNHVLLWGKAIKNEVYKSALNLLGKERFSNFIIWAEDTSIFFVISNVAKSFKSINDYGLIHIYYGKSSSAALSKDDRRKGELFLLNIVIDFSKNEYKKNGALALIQLIDNYKSLTNDNIKQSLKTLINKILKCDYIEEKIKNEIKIKYNSFI